MLHQFEKWLEIWILICLLKGCHATDSIKRELKLVKGPNCCQGKVPIDGFLGETAVNNKIKCAKTCSTNEKCASMYYFSNSKTCKIHDQEIIEIPDDQLVSNSEVMYYVPDKNDQSTMVPITTTLVTVTEDAPCPNDTSVFQRAQTSDGTRFLFRIFLDIPCSFDDAQALCECHGAKLYKLLTPVKMAFTLSLMTCQAYQVGDISYWVNARIESGAGGWQTTDGDTMPTNSTFWDTDRPEAGRTPPRCARLWDAHNYKLDDAKCSIGTNAIRYAFCEK